MKKKLLSFLLLVLIGGFLASCDEDNGLQLGDPEIPENAISQTVASVYHGQMVRIIEQQAGSGINNVTQEAITNNIILVGDETSSMVKLKFQNFRFQGETAIDEWEIPDVSLFKDGNLYYLNGEARDIALWDDKDGRIARVYVSGIVEGDSLHVTIDIKTPGFQGAYAENMNIKFNGKGGHTIGTDAEITSFELEANPVINKVTLNQVSREIVVLVNKDAIDHQLRFNANVVGSEGALLSVGFSDFTGELDFTGGKAFITVKVVSEDGLVNNSYKIYCVKLMDLDFTFDSWSSTELGFDQATGWSSNNENFGYLKIMGEYSGEYPIQKVNNSVRIKTVDANGIVGTFVPAEHKKAMAGFFYLGGKFDIDLSAIGKFAESNKLGIIYKSQPKPLKFKGKYSYSAGTTVYDKDANKIEGVTDECLLGFYLYEVANESETLDAVSIRTSDKVVAKAEVISGNTSETSFDVDIEYRNGYTYDASKTYKLVILLTSSKDGHIYQGAPGSTLNVSEVSVATE